MNKNFNEWYIEKSIPIKEGQLEKRWSSIERFADNITADDIVNLVKKFFNIPVDDNFMNSFAEAFIKDDPSFSRSYTNELSVLSGATLFHLSEKGEYYRFVELAVLAASFGRAPIVEDMLIGIQKEFYEDSFSIREDNSNKVQQIKLPSIDPLLKALEETGEETEYNQELSNYVKSVDASFKEINKIFEQINESQEIYFEDSQLLWWLTSGWCREFDCSYNDLDKKNACLILGQEAAELVHVFPGPYSIKGVFSKMLENCKGKNTNLQFIDVISAFVDKWSVKHDNSKLLELLPITTALIRSKNTSSMEEWIPKYILESQVSLDKIKTKPPLEYAMQFYLEVLVQKCYSML